MSKPGRRLNREAITIIRYPLALQEHMIRMAKKIALMVAGGAAMKFRQNLAKEQEVPAL